MFSHFFRQSWSFIWFFLFYQEKRKNALGMWSYYRWYTFRLHPLVTPYSSLDCRIAPSPNRPTDPSFQSREKKERSTLSWYSDNSTCPFSLARPRENGQKEKGAPQNRPPTPSDPVLKGVSCFQSSLYFRRWVNRLLSISRWRFAWRMTRSPGRPTEKMTIRTFQVSRQKQIWDSWGVSQFTGYDLF